MSVLWSILILTVSVLKVRGQCTKIDDCSCSMPDGQIVDMSDLGDQNGFAKFFALPAPDGFYYSLNLCYPFNEGSCFNAASCQTSADFLNTYQIGDASSASFYVDGTNAVHVTYTAPTGDGNTRTADVLLSCEPTAIEPSLIVHGEQGFLIYAFTVITRCACPGLCAESPIGPGGNTHVAVEAGISAGTVLCILFIVLLVVYVAGGMTYMRVRKNRRGAEMIPQREFWAGLPGLIKDGAVFTYQKIRNKVSGKTYSEI